MSDPDDASIRLQHGDRDPLITYIESHRSELLAFIHRSLSDTLRSRVEPQDILQETTISALDLIEQSAPPDRDLFGWLCHIAERRIIDAHRKHVGAQKRSARREANIDGDRNLRGGLAELLVASMTSPSSAFSRRQKEFYMLQALDSLPEESREAIRLRYIENLPTKEIADQLGKSDGAVRVLLSRSLARLQTQLAANSVFQSLHVQKPDTPR